MARQHLFPLLIFVAGMVIGIIATGEYSASPEPESAITRPGPVGAPQGLTTQGGVGLSTQEVASANAVAIIGEESLPSALSTSRQWLDLEGRLRAMTTAWAELQTELASLRTQVDGLQRRLPATNNPREASGTHAPEPSRLNTPENRRSALVAAGVDEDRAADIIWRQGQQELDHLELRDIATREGWFGSDRYREELNRINQDTLDLREAIGEDSYDRYLFAAGEDNRVAIAAIIPGSTAEDASLQPGDLVESYGDRRVFRFTDLQAATMEGDRDELVLVRIRRGDAMLDVWLPRGPLGVHLGEARIDPEI